MESAERGRHVRRAIYIDKNKDNDYNDDGDGIGNGDKNDNGSSYHRNNDMVLIFA